MGQKLLIGGDFYHHQKTSAHWGSTYNVGMMMTVTMTMIPMEVVALPK
jgi:hypothetical protein